MFYFIHVNKLFLNTEMVFLKKRENIVVQIQIKALFPNAKVLETTEIAFKLGIRVQLIKEVLMGGLVVCSTVDPSVTYVSARK